MINLPAPPVTYSRSIEAERNRLLELADLHNVKHDSDMEFVNNKLVIRAADGSRWEVKVSPAGVLSTVAL